MKLQQIQEATYATKPPDKGWSADKVIQTFFVLEKEWTEEMLDYDDKSYYLYGARAYSVPEDRDIVVFDRDPVYGTRITALYKLKDGTYLFQDADNEREWTVDPSKFHVLHMQPIYAGK
jgi:hypothetical protein